MVPTSSAVNVNPGVNPGYKPWPYTSRFYNPLTMQGAVIAERNDNLVYEGRRLDFLHMTNSVVGEFCHPRQQAAAKSPLLATASLETQTDVKL